MTILNKDVLLEHGPYINMVYRKSPLSVAEGEWPSMERYDKDIFFDLADDLLDDHLPDHLPDQKKYLYRTSPLRAFASDRFVTS